MTYRDMSKYRVAAASISHVAIYPEVQRTLDAWNTLGINSVLIGGLAMSLYSKPRTTEDVDMLFLHETDIPNSLDGFKKVSPHNFCENKTHVTVEAVTSITVNIPQSLVAKVFASAWVLDGMLVASREGLIALKLHGSDNIKRKRNDLADVARLVEPTTTMDGWDLSPYHQSVFEEIRNEMS